MTYTAELIYLDGRPTIRVSDGHRLVGYFTDIKKINDYGRPIDMIDVVIKGGT